MKPVAIAMNVFAGGFALGIRQHFRVVADLEETGYGSKTMIRNQPGVRVHVGSDRWPVAEMKEKWGAPDLIFSNPPCAPWSSLGRIVQAGAENEREQWSTDRRVLSTRVCFNALSFFRPKVWVWESVQGAWNRGRSFVDELTASAHAEGYDVTYVLHDAARIGGRQHRKRFFFVAHRVDIDWSLDLVQPPVVADVLRDFERELKRGAANANVSVVNRFNMTVGFLRSVRPGEPLRTAHDRYVETLQGRKERDAGRLPKTGFAARRLALDRACPATVSAMLLHPTQSRFLTIPELAYFASFPPTYEFIASSDLERAKLLGRGVLPIVGDWLGRQLAHAVRRNEPTAGGRRFLFDGHGERASVKEF